MGKHKRAALRAQAAAVQQAATASTERVPLLRDAVTGEKLYTLPRLAIIVRDERVERDYQYDDSVCGRTSVPRAIDTHRQYLLGHLGGMEWHAEFAHYIADVVPREVHEQRRAWHQWWTNAYVMSRLRHHVRRDRLDAALRVLVEHEHPLLVARALRHSDAWVDGCCREVLRLVRTRYYPREQRHGLPERALRRETLAAVR